MARAQSAAGLQLQLRRMPGSLELVIQNAGLGNDFAQRREGNAWVGELRTTELRQLRSGPQSLALTEAGVASVTFDGTGRLFSLKVTPTPGAPLGTPVIGSNGEDLVIRFAAPQQQVSQTAQFDARQAAATRAPDFVPPLRPRAVAPPVGDMAIGTMVLKNRGFVNLSGPLVTITARGANARDLLMLLARMGNYGFAFDDAQPGVAGRAASSGDAAAGVAQGFPVTVAFNSEPYERAFNFVLLAAGLQARKEGNTILVGKNVLSKSIGSQFSKVYRLNQVTAESAADYLANLGAQVTKTNTISTSVSTGATATSAVGPSSSTTTSSTTTTVEAYGAANGPLLGLQATTDSRLGTITLYGEASVIAVAEQFLRRLDLRQRQVALSVKILDVSLENSEFIDNSFSARFGDTFLINDGGQLLAAFGRGMPANQSTFNNSTSREEVRYNDIDSSFFDSASESASARNRGQTANSRDASNRSSSSSSGFNSASTSGSGSSGSSVSGSTNSTTTTFTVENSSLDTTTLDAIRSVIGSSLRPNDIAVTTTFPTRSATSSPVTNITVTTPNGTFDSATSLNQNVRSTADIIRRLTNSSVNSSTVDTSRSESSFGSSSSSRSASSQSSSDESVSDSGGTSASTSSSRRESARRGRTTSNRSRRTVVEEDIRLNPGLAYPENVFFDFLRAQITSRSTKLLASPTLILQEGGADRSSEVGRSKANEAEVSVGDNVVTSYTVSNVGTGASASIACQPQFTIAGLSLGAVVEKIDDNGFVTFSVEPQVSVPVGGQTVQGCGPITVLNERKLTGGSIRVRDGQTLLLTGVISEDDRQIVQKWPILGDLPLIGQFFRNSSGGRNKRELVILVTPRIIRDDDGGSYGYGYTPSTQDARQLFYGS
jgi:type IV pilus assembly protein PilQ